MKAPVGKSGPGSFLMSCPSVASGCLISSIVASITSERLCGGMLVAMPTAMPDERAVVVRRPVDRLLVDVVAQQLGREAREPHLGVAHRRGVVAVDRAEVALPVDERIAQREVLRHADDRVVHGALAVRVVLAED